MKILTDSQPTSLLVPSISSLRFKDLLLVLIIKTHLLIRLKRSQEPLILENKLMVIEDPLIVVHLQVNIQLMMHFTLLLLLMLPIRWTLVPNISSSQSQDLLLINIDWMKVRPHQKLKWVSSTIKHLQKEEDPMLLHHLETTINTWHQWAITWAKPFHLAINTNRLKAILHLAPSTIQMILCSAPIREHLLPSLENQRWLLLIKTCFHPNHHSTWREVFSHLIDHDQRMKQEARKLE